MKKLLLLLLLVLPFSVSAKFYSATVHYKNGESSKLEAKFPLNVAAKTLVVKKNGDRDRIELDNVSFLEVYLNGNKNIYYFKRGKVTHFRNNGTHKSLKREVWSLLHDVNEDLVTSVAGIQYTIKKSKGEEKVVVVYDYASQGYYLSKPKEYLLVSIEPIMGVTLKKMVERSQDYLFPKCPNFSEKLDLQEIKKGEHIQTIVNLYKNCSN